MILCIGSMAKTDSPCEDIASEKITDARMHNDPSGGRHPDSKNLLWMILLFKGGMDLGSGDGFGMELLTPLGSLTTFDRAASLGHPCIYRWYPYHW